MTTPTNKLLLLGLALLVALGLGEGLLRLLGARPGVYQLSKEFKVVDSLVLYKNFITDEAGIYKFGPWVIDSFNVYIKNTNDKTFEKRKDSAVHPEDDIEYIYSSFLRLLNPSINYSLILKLKLFFTEEKIDCSFTKVVNGLHASKAPLDEWGEAVIHYSQHPFNKEGFRSIPFSPYTGQKKKILVVGDSYVYGMSARPYYNSFVDELLADGQMVYAAGIPGTDPAQYAAIVEKYVPLLNPDLVIVCFYMGNDLMEYPRVSRSSEPHEHICNAGFMQSNINGKYYDEKSAYGYYKNLFLIPKKTNLFNTIMAKSSLTSLMWGFLLQHNWVTHQALEDYERGRQVPIEQKIVNTIPHIQHWESVCSKLNVRCINAVIPDKTSSYVNKDGILLPDTALLNKLFKNGYVFPDSLHHIRHHATKDYHFNNAGSEHYYRFLKQYITL